MRDAAAVRRRLLSTLDHSTRRPGMHATTGREYELFARSIIGDICFIDERDDDYDRVRKGLASRHGSRGVAGAFDEAFGDTCSYVAEVASVFAQVAAQLGLLDIPNRRSRDDWDALAAGLATGSSERDRRCSDVIAEHGEPSLAIDRRVLCYVGPDDDDWIVFECWEPWVQEYQLGRGSISHHRPEDPALRDIRIPAATFAESLVLTRYGKLLRRWPRRD